MARALKARRESELIPGGFLRRDFALTTASFLRLAVGRTYSTAANSAQGKCFTVAFSSSPPKPMEPPAIVGSSEGSTGFGKTCRGRFQQPVSARINFNLPGHTSAMGAAFRGLKSHRRIGAKSPAPKLHRPASFAGTGDVTPGPTSSLASTTESSVVGRPLQSLFAPSEFLLPAGAVESVVAEHASESVRSEPGRFDRSIASPPVLSAGWVGFGVIGFSLYSADLAFDSACHEMPEAASTKEATSTPPSGRRVGSPHREGN